MPYSKNLPCVMCIMCKHYKFANRTSRPHYCKSSGAFHNLSKLNQDPDKDGTAGMCKVFKPK